MATALVQFKRGDSVDVAKLGVTGAKVLAILNAPTQMLMVAYTHNGVSCQARVAPADAVKGS